MNWIEINKITFLNDGLSIKASRNVKQEGNLSKQRRKKEEERNEITIVSYSNQKRNEKKVTEYK